MGYYISYHYNEKLIYISGFFLGMAILSKITAVFTALAIATYPLIAKDLKHWIYKKFDSSYVNFLKENYFLDEITARLLSIRNVDKK